MVVYVGSYIWSYTTGLDGFIVEGYTYPGLGLLAHFWVSIARASCKGKPCSWMALATFLALVAH